MGGSLIGLCDELFCLLGGWRKSRKEGWKRKWHQSGELVHDVLLLETCSSE